MISYREKIEKEGGQLKKNMALFLMDPLQV